MAAHGFISADRATRAMALPIVTVTERRDKPAGASAVVDNVLDELKTHYGDLGEKDLMRGSIQVYSTVDAQVQAISNLALEHGLMAYENATPAPRPDPRLGGRLEKPRCHRPRRDRWPPVLPRPRQRL